MMELDLDHNRHVLDVLRHAVMDACEENNLGFNAGIEIRDDLIRVETRISRDPRLSRNGGEYFEWVELEPLRGNILAWNRTSCELVPRGEPIAKGDHNWAHTVEYALALAKEYKVPVSAKWQLVNHARCEVCGASASWHLFDGVDHYVCDRHDWYKGATP